jgi:hypothetical protein
MMLDSKRPDEALIFSLLDGDPRARAIVNSWRVKLPVTALATDEFDALVSRSHTVFDCLRQDAEGVSADSSKRDEDQSAWK